MSCLVIVNQGIIPGLGPPILGKNHLALKVEAQNGNFSVQKMINHRIRGDPAVPSEEVIWVSLGGSSTI